MGWWRNDAGLLANTRGGAALSLRRVTGRPVKFIGVSEQLEGLQEEAREAHRIEVYCTSFRPMQTAFINRPDRVLFKLVVDRDSRKVLGCHIVADGAGELIQLAAE